MDFWHYPNCSTCVKARRFLEAHNLDFKAIDLVKTPPSATRLKKMHAASDRELKAFFNTSGQSYRNGGFKDRLPLMSDAEKFAALAADGKLIKRPILETDSGVVVGFKEDQWRALLGV